MVHTQLDQVDKSQNDLLAEINDNMNDHVVRVMTRGGRMTREPPYPEGHPKRIEQDPQRINDDSPSPTKTNKHDRTMHASSDRVIEKHAENHNDVSISDAQTQSGGECSPSDNENDNNNDAHVDVQPDSNKEPNNDAEMEPPENLDNPHPKTKHYEKKDFVARKHGKVREPWVEKPMPFPCKPSKSKDGEEFECFAEMIKHVFLRTRLTDILRCLHMLSI